MRIGIEAGKSFAYLLGVYLGDGCVSKTQDGYLVYTQNTIDEDFAHAVKKAVSDITGSPFWMRKYAVKKSVNPAWFLRFGDQDLCRKLQDDTEMKSRIPNYVFCWPLESARAFIAGLMDSEGFVAKKTPSDDVQHTDRSFYMGFKSCDTWVNEFVRLLASVGVKVGKVSDCPPRKPGYKTPVRFSIKMRSFVDSGCYFNIRRKQDRLDLWDSTEPYSQRRRNPRRLTSEANTPNMLFNA